MKKKKEKIWREEEEERDEENEEEKQKKQEKKRGGEIGVWGRMGESREKDKNVKKSWRNQRRKAINYNQQQKINQVDKNLKQE